MAEPHVQGQNFQQSFRTILELYEQVMLKPQPSATDYMATLLRLDCARLRFANWGASMGLVAATPALHLPGGAAADTILQHTFNEMIHRLELATDTGGRRHHSGPPYGLDALPPTDEAREVQALHARFLVLTFARKGLPVPERRPARPLRAWDGYVGPEELIAGLTAVLDGVMEAVPPPEEEWERVNAVDVPGLHPLLEVAAEGAYEELCDRMHHARTVAGMKARLQREEGRRNVGDVKSQGLKSEEDVKPEIKTEGTAELELDSERDIELKSELKSESE
ncbi:hypothetical protein GTA08_BOTSDO04717 [Botryosphaeria dothidea]|uniref:Uncharacterized protein n=1 Tax=Botryosphaeria dothidea TaxID=55169 RepID=A0A8H4J024_9PEZI|nr:hypothetical protein GTA08_BOTSDO04717 [Botryosphaeria dothidea]